MPQPITTPPPLLQPGLLQLQHVQDTPMPWLWPGRFALGKLNLLVAPPGAGKSLIALDIAARVSAGHPWPDLPDQEQKPGGVLLVSDSTLLADTVIPRLKAAHADLARINVLTSLNPDPFDPNEAPSPRTHDLSRLEQAIDSTPDCRLILVDPIAYSTPRSVAVGQMASTIALAPLCRMAAHRKLALLAVAPIRTLASPQGILNAANSLTFNALAATSWTVIPDRHQTERRFLLSLKTTFTHDTPNLTCRITTTEEPSHTPHVIWEETTTDLSLESVLDYRNTLTEQNEAASWLESLLQDGPVPASDILDRAHHEGITRRSARKALDTLGGVCLRKGFGPDGKWLWALNSQQAQELQAKEEQAQSQQPPPEPYDPTKYSDYEEDRRLRDIELEQESQPGGFFYAPDEEDDDF